MVKIEKSPPGEERRPITLTPEQARAARAMLRWTVRETGQRAGCGANTVNRFEQGTDAREGTRTALRAAYEAAGVLFIAENGEGPGVRLRKLLGASGAS